jgi:hypothetical protein
MHFLLRAVITLMLEAVRTSETSVYYNETTWHNIPEGSNLQVKANFKTISHTLYNYLTML